MDLMNDLKTKLRLNGALLAALSCAAFLTSCSKSDPATRTAEPGKPRPVQAAPAATRPMERITTATGSLAAQEQATLSVKVPGRLQTLAVDLGSEVKKGDILARVDPGDYELRVRQSAAALAQARALLGLSLDGTNDTVELEKTSLVRQAKAVLDEAAKNRERVQSLARTGISPASEVDTVESAYVVALNRYEAAFEEVRTRQATLAQRRAELDLAQKQLSDTSLRAPFDGAVQSRLAGVGEFQQSGTPVVSLVRTDPLRLRLEVAERDAAGVRLGQPLRLRVEGHTNWIAGTIARLSPAISEQSRMLIVEADIPNTGALRAGQFVRAEIVTNERDPGLAVPAAAIVAFAGLEKVVTIAEGKAVEKSVTTGRRGGDWVEIITGLKPGETVVLHPGNLRTGQAVVLSEGAALQTSKATPPTEP
jgi:RND family efflux transporter MFP subunit